MRIDDTASKLLFDINTPNYSYLIGFIQSDGNLIRTNKALPNKGRMSIELSIKDVEILKKIKEIIPVFSSIGTRKRNTNFKNDYESVSLRVYSKQFRETINYYGVSYGKKSNNINVPNVEYIENDYWRGIIDGDGSLGFTKDGRVYISLVTNSEMLIQSYFKFLYKITGKIYTRNRNVRDKAYNLIVFNEDAKKLCKALYYKDCLSINRKYDMSVRIEQFNVPPYVNHKWSKEDKLFIMNNLNKDCLVKFADKKISQFDYVRTYERSKFY